MENVNCIESLKITKANKKTCVIAFCRWRLEAKKLVPLAAMYVTYSACLCPASQPCFGFPAMEHRCCTRPCAPRHRCQAKPPPRHHVPPPYNFEYLWGSKWLSAEAEKWIRLFQFCSNINHKFQLLHSLAKDESFLLHIFFTSIWTKGREKDK